MLCQRVLRNTSQIYTDSNALAEYPRVSAILLKNVAGEVWSYGDCHCRNRWSVRKRQLNNKGEHLTRRCHFSKKNEVIGY